MKFTMEVSALADWQRLKKEYIKGGISYRELAEKHKVSFSQLQKVAAKEKWNDLRKKADRKAEEKLVEMVSNQQAEFGQDIYRAADLLLQKLVEQVENTKIITAPMMRQYTASLKDLKEIKDIRSDADLREQEARIAKLQKEAEKDKEADKTVEVAFVGGDVEEWSE
jgi:cytidylate kinase